MVATETETCKVSNRDMVYKVPSKQNDSSNFIFESIENRNAQYTLRDVEEFVFLQNKTLKIFNTKTLFT